MQETIAPIQNKIGQIFFAPPLRHVLGQVGTKINFRFMMDRRRVFIANLSRGNLFRCYMTSTPGQLADRRGSAMPCVELSLRKNWMMLTRRS
jgi:hypothetical protein